MPAILCLIFKIQEKFINNSIFFGNMHTMYVSSTMKGA